MPSNGAIANHETYKKTEVFFDSNITTYITNKFIYLEIYDMNRSFFPFIHHYQPFGIVILQLPWFLVNSFDCIQGKLGEILKIEITEKL